MAPDTSSAVEAWRDVFEEWSRYTADVPRYEEEVAATTMPSARSDACYAALARVNVPPVRNCVLFERPGRECGPGRGFGDVLVGFRNTGPTGMRVALQVDGVTVSNQELAPGAAVLALADNCLPLSCLCFAPVRIWCPPGARVVMAYLPFEPRRQLACGSWRLGEAVIARGRMDPEDTAGLSLHCLPPAWRLKAAAKRRLQDTYLRELMAAACRPERLQQITGELD